MKKVKMLGCVIVLFFGASFFSPKVEAGEMWTLYEIYADDGTFLWADCLPVSGNCFVVEPEQ